MRSFSNKPGLLMKKLCVVIAFILLVTSSACFITFADSTGEVVYTEYNGQSGWWYVKDGSVDPEYTGIAPNQYGWWRIVNGAVDFDAEGVFLNEYGWWYVKGGMVQFDFTGLRPNANGWWRIVNGGVDFSAEGVFQNEYGWWYVKDGKVQFDFTGIRPNEYGWWKIVNGSVDFSAEGVFPNEYGWWYVKGGMVQFDFTGLRPNANGWWRIVNGGVDFSANGLYPNEYGWWYVKDGKVDFSYTGFATNEYGTWWVVNGAVDFSYTGGDTDGSEKAKAAKVYLEKLKQVQEDYSKLEFFTEGTYFDRVIFADITGDGINEMLYYTVSEAAGTFTPSTAYNFKYNAYSQYHLITYTADNDIDSDFFLGLDGYIVPTVSALSSEYRSFMPAGLGDFTYYIVPGSNLVYKLMPYSVSHLVYGVYEYEYDKDQNALAFVGNVNFSSGVVSDSTGMPQEGVPDENCYAIGEGNDIGQKVLISQNSGGSECLSLTYGEAIAYLENNME